MRRVRGVDWLSSCLAEAEKVGDEHSFGQIWEQKAACKAF